MSAIAENFLGNSPAWYKRTIVAFLVLNPILFAIDPYIAGWALVLEFIFTLAMALSCYPLQPGGLLAFEAVVIGMTSPAAVYQVTINALEVVLLLIFMVAGIFFLKDLLLFTFTKLVVQVRSKILLSLLFSAGGGTTVGVSGCAHRHGRGDHRRERVLWRLPQGCLRQTFPSPRSRFVRSTRTFRICTARISCSFVRSSAAS